MPAVRPARIPIKEISQATSTSQDHATGGVTHNGGLATGAGERENVPPVREQRMGRCTIQLVRVAEDKKPNAVDPVEQLWWVTPATEVAVKELRIGEDVTKQQSADCGFRDTKMRVRIHCLQHLLQISLPVPAYKDQP